MDGVERPRHLPPGCPDGPPVHADSHARFPPDAYTDDNFAAGRVTDSLPIDHFHIWIDDRFRIHRLSAGGIGIIANSSRRSERKKRRQDVAFHCKIENDNHTAFGAGKQAGDGPSPAHGHRRTRNRVGQRRCRGPISYGVGRLNATLILSANPVLLRRHFLTARNSPRMANHRSYDILCVKKTCRYHPEINSDSPCGWTSIRTSRNFSKKPSATINGSIRHTAGNYAKSTHFGSTATRSSHLGSIDSNLLMTSSLPTSDSGNIVRIR